MSSTSISLPEQRQMCGAVISSELLRVLYVAHYRHVLQICRKFFRHLEDAEDAAAEVFLKLYRVLHQKDELVPFPPWISQMALITVSTTFDEESTRRAPHWRKSMLTVSWIIRLLLHSRKLFAT